MRIFEPGAGVSISTSALGVVAMCVTAAAYAQKPAAADTGIPSFTGALRFQCTNAPDFVTKIRGPGGVTADLRVGAGDDGAKEHHNCLYAIWFDTHGNAGKPQGAGTVTNSDGDWNRPYMVRVDGFSQDGRHIFGVVAEDGETSVFDYEVAQDHAESAVPGPCYSGGKRVNCGQYIRVYGVTKSGSPVLEALSPTPSAKSRHVILDVRCGKIQDVAPDEKIEPLYRAN